MKDDELREQINALIRTEIQDVINDYVDETESQVFRMENTGVGFVESKDDKELKVNISNQEVELLIKKYKKMKKSERSNLSHIKKLDA